MWRNCFPAGIQATERGGEGMSQWRIPRPGHGKPAGPVLFLDRDGVVIRDRDYLGDPAGVELLPGAAAAMARARAAGFLLIGLSNQSGIGRGLFSEDDLDKVMARLDELLGREGTGFDGFFYCPHAPDQGCTCRKPAQGLLTEAGRHFSWDPDLSCLVGDKSSDIELGRAAGLRSFLVRTGYGTQQENEVNVRWPAGSGVEVVADLQEAVRQILGDEVKG